MILNNDQNGTSQSTILFRSGSSVRTVFKRIVPVLILFVTSTISAQTLSGVVVDGNGAAIEKAAVVLLEGNFQNQKLRRMTKAVFSAGGDRPARPPTCYRARFCSI